MKIDIYFVRKPSNGKLEVEGGHVVKEKTYSPKKVLSEWKKLTVPSPRFFAKAVSSVVIFTLIFAGYFALCELGSLNLVQFIYGL